MDPFDPQTVRAVWERVHSTQEQQLAAMIAGEKQAQATYSLLAKLFPKHRTTFSTIAAEEARHFKQLSTLYYLLYGAEAVAVSEKSPHIEGLQEVLRSCYAQELRSAQEYYNASTHFPGQTQLFRLLSQEESRHAQSLLRLTESLLFPQSNR
ncbi:MAG: long-chain fatty aldehyde decarbonylase [Oscillospiraceae bacterium]|nr:long-chain fatty aldehyde decarbonylase [Oscillospiraceae bacterium]